MEASGRRVPVTPVTPSLARTDSWLSAPPELTALAAAAAAAACVVLPRLSGVETPRNAPPEPESRSASSDSSVAITTATGPLNATRGQDPWPEVEDAVAGARVAGVAEAAFSAEEPEDAVAAEAEEAAEAEAEAAVDAEAEAAARPAVDAGRPVPADAAAAADAAAPPAPLLWLRVLTGGLCCVGGVALGLRLTGGEGVGEPELDLVADEAAELAPPPAPPPPPILLLVEDVASEVSDAAEPVEESECC